MAEKKNHLLIFITLTLIITSLILLSLYLKNIINNENMSGNKDKKITSTPDLTSGNFNTDKNTTDNKEKTPPKKEVLDDKYFQTFVAKSGLENQYHLYGNIETNSHTGLLIYLHGDGAKDFNSGINSQSLNKLINVGKKNNLLPVAIKTPSPDLTWWQDGYNNAKFLNDFFVEYLFTNFDLDENRVLLVGYSGGSELITEFFLFNYAQNLFTGGTVLFGGGSVQYDHNSNVQFNENFKNLFKIHYYSGTKDFMYEKAKYGAEFFIRKGFNVSTEHPDGIDHYNLPMSTVVDQQLKNGLLKN